MTPAPARAVLADCDHIATTRDITAGQTVCLLTCRVPELGHRR
jgi:hypothetical protein